MPYWTMRTLKNPIIKKHQSSPKKVFCPNAACLVYLRRGDNDNQQAALVMIILSIIFMSGETATEGKYSSLFIMN